MHQNRDSISGDAFPCLDRAHVAFHKPPPAHSLINCRYSGVLQIAQLLRCTARDIADNRSHFHKHPRGEISCRMPLKRTLKLYGGKPSAANSHAQYATTIERFRTKSETRES